MYKCKKKTINPQFLPSLYLNITFISVIMSLVFGSCSSLPGRSEPVTDRFEEAQKSYSLGESQYDQGSYDNALTNFQAALKLFGSLDEREGVVRAYLAMGESNLALAESERALYYYEWALLLAEDLNNRELIRDVVNHLGNYSLALNDLPGAQNWYSYKSDLPENKSEVLSEFYRLGGTIAKRGGHFEKALELYNIALDIDNSLTDFSRIGSNFYLMGSAYSLMGNYPLAEKSLLKALDRDKYFEILPGIAADLLALGIVLEKSERSHEAVIYYKRAYMAWAGLEREDKLIEISEKIVNIGGELNVIP